MSSSISQNLTEIEVVTGCTFACICHTVFRMCVLLFTKLRMFEDDSF